MNRFPALSLAAMALLCVQGTAVAAEPTALRVVAVERRAGDVSHSIDGVVEAVRQTTLSTQVAGAVVVLHVKAGDTVRAGQPLLQIDARAAQQAVLGSNAQLEAAQAQLAVTSKEFERQKQLLQKQYISQAALERAQAQWDAAKAQVKALQAQTQVAQTQSGFFVVNAPYAGVVSDVSVTLGDMAMPGRPLVTVYAPSVLRVTAAVPQALLATLGAQQKAIRYELPGVAGHTKAQTPQQVQVLPTVDPVTHTGQVRLSLAAGVPGLAPGLFARVWLPADGTEQASDGRMYLPTSAIVRRGEMTGVYVINAQGKPSLRQVRLGQAWADRVEVLSGLRPGDKVAAEPQLVGTVH